MQMYPQVMINVRLPAGANGSELCQLEAIRDSVSQVEQELNGTGRVLLRASGTEPVIRVMVEGQDATQVDRYCKTISGVVSAQL